MVRKKGKRKGKKPKAKRIWIQSTYQYHKDILVTSGCSAKEILQAIKRYKGQQWMVDFATENQKRWQEIIDAGTAFVTCEPTRGALILRLRPFEDSWEFWETLLHELSHTVDFMADKMRFESETEAKAYLQEFLFRNIRRKFQGLQPIHSDGK